VSDSEEFAPDAFVERLRQIRKATGLTGARIAQRGRITKQTFSGYLHTGRLPSAAVLANWVLRLGINANWLLTGEGPVMLEGRDAARPEQGTALDDPVVRRVAVVVARMREAGAGEGHILQSVQAMLDGDLLGLEQGDAAQAAAAPPVGVWCYSSSATGLASNASHRAPCASNAALPQAVPAAACTAAMIERCLSAQDCEG